MKTAYIVQTGATLRREGNLLEVHVQRKREAQIPVYELKQLVIAGNVLITPGALDLLLERGVDTVLLTQRGKYRARIVGRGSTHVALRLAQYEALRDPDRVVTVSKAIVAGKIANQRTFLMHHARDRENASDLRRASLSMRATLERLGEAKTPDEVRGCEGAAAAAYFRAFGHLIEVPAFAFQVRSRRPPMDPTNALLSLGYTFLFNVVESAVHVVGLDPYLGALHATESGRASLVCDLQEEFRTPVVDALVVAAIAHGAMQPGDFEDAGEGQPVVMKQEAVRTFATLFERRLARPRETLSLAHGRRAASASNGAALLGGRSLRTFRDEVR